MRAKIVYPAKLVINGEVVKDKFPQWGKWYEHAPKPVQRNENLNVPRSGSPMEIPLVDFLQNPPRTRLAARELPPPHENRTTRPVYEAPPPNDDRTAQPDREAPPPHDDRTAQAEHETPPSTTMAQHGLTEPPLGDRSHWRFYRDRLGIPTRPDHRVRFDPGKQRN